MDKRFWGVITVIGLIFVGIIVANNMNKAETADGGSKATVQATSHTKGEGAKSVTLVEYGDFQCPVCSLYEPTIQELVTKYQADIKFQYRHFPLQQIHQNAFAAARAAEAAGEQGKFWEMHDQLYAQQNAWSAATDPVSEFEGYAKTLGMDTAKFRTDFTAKKVNDAINADIREGNKLKVSGTPAFFVNGELIKLESIVGDDNRPSLDKFSKIIDDAIAKK